VYHVTGQGQQWGQFSYFTRAEFHADGRIQTTQLCSTNGTPISVPTQGAGNVASDESFTMTDSCNGAVLNQCTGNISNKNGVWTWDGRWARADHSDSGTFTSQKVDDSAPQRFQEQSRAPAARASFLLQMHLHSAYAAAAPVTTAVTATASASPYGR
jgi:hypothetical protein